MIEEHPCDPSELTAPQAATVHLTKMIANEIQENGLKIRVNSIAPGVFPSEMASDGSDEKQKSQ